MAVNKQNPATLFGGRKWPTYVIEVNCVINSVLFLHSLRGISIADLPKDGPHIVGERRIYNPGDLLTLNCSSGKSHPASSLHWFINGVQVSPFVHCNLHSNLTKN